MGGKGRRPTYLRHSIQKAKPIPLLSLPYSSPKSKQVPFTVTFHSSQLTILLFFNNQAQAMRSLLLIVQELLTRQAMLLCSNTDAGMHIYHKRRDRFSYDFYLQWDNHMV